MIISEGKHNFVQGNSLTNYLSDKSGMFLIDGEQKD